MSSQFRGDVSIANMGGLATVPTQTMQVDDRTTSSDTQIFPGDPVKLTSEGSNFVTHLATGDPEIGTDIMFGIAATISTETSTVDGFVDVYSPIQGIVYRCKATTSGNIATGILYDTVTFDLTTTTYTVDENEGSDENVHGLRIVQIDADAGTVDFEIKDGATRYNALVA